MCSHFLSYSAHFKLNVFVVVICTYTLRLKIYMFDIQRPTPKNNILSIYLVPTNKLRSKRAPIINQEVTSPLKDIE